MREPGEMMLLDRRLCAFSLVEIMVSLAVLLMLMVLVGQLMKSASAITRVGVKHIDADTQARAVLELPPGADCFSTY